MGPVRGTTLAALWLGLAVGASPSVAAQGPEPELVELRLDHIASRTVQAYRVRTEVLVPLTQFLELAEIRYRLSLDGRIEPTVDPGGGRLVVDVSDDTMRYGDLRVRIGPEFKLFRDGELYVGAERLGDLLGSPLATDFTELTVIMADPSELPLARRLRRDAARAALLRAREAPIRPDRILGFERPRWDGLVLDYSVLSPSSDPVAGSGYAAAIGADVLGGSLELAGASVGRAADGVVRVDGSWTGVWPTGNWVRQVRLGDATSTGPRLRSVRGFAISNAPYVRPSVIGVAPYGGQLEPGGGWSVEAYRGTDLLGFDSVETSGRFTMPLPVRYGENPVDLVAYGPLGEIREFNQTYRVVSELLPAGRFEYGVSLGSCRSGLCEATGNADVRYGATARWTVQAGLDQFWRDTLPDLSHAYLSLAASPRNAWAVTLDGVMAALVHGGIRGDAIIRRRERVCAAAADARPGPRPPLAARRDRDSPGRCAAALELLGVRRASHRLGVPDGSGRDLAPRRPGGRPHALAHVVLVGPPLAHHRDRAGGRHGHRLTTRPAPAAAGARVAAARAEGVAGVLLVRSSGRTWAAERFTAFADGGSYAMGIKPGA